MFESNGRPIYEMTEEDLKNYYNIGSEFSYNGDIYILDFVEEDEVGIKKDDSTEVLRVPIKDVTRIV